MELCCDSILYPGSLPLISNNLKRLLHFVFKVYLSKKVLVGQGILRVLATNLLIGLDMLPISKDADNKTESIRKSSPQLHFPIENTFSLENSGNILPSLEKS